MGFVLFVDTGIDGFDAELDVAHRRRTRYRRSWQFLAVVVDAHLHFDHCSGNQLFPGMPIHVQAHELEDAEHDDYTVREWVRLPRRDVHERGRRGGDSVPACGSCRARPAPPGTRSPSSRPGGPGRPRRRHWLTRSGRSARDTPRKRFVLKLPRRRTRALRRAARAAFRRIGLPTHPVHTVSAASALSSMRHVVRQRAEQRSASGRPTSSRSRCAAHRDGQSRPRSRRGRARSRPCPCGRRRPRPGRGR